VLVMPYALIVFPARTRHAKTLNFDDGTNCDDFTNCGTLLYDMFRGHYSNGVDKRMHAHVLVRAGGVSHLDDD
jgi:hypothetical protein